MTATITITPLQRVEAVFRPEPWPWADANRAAIEKHWAAIAADRPGLFNGRVLLCAHRSIADGVMRGQYREVDYASFLAWRDFGWPDRDAANCFAMAALTSRDGAFLLGEMGPQTANAGRIYFPAGTPDLDDLTPEGDVDLAGSVLRELAEETGLQPNEVSVEDGWILVDEAPRLALMRTVRSPLDANALKARIDAWLATQDAPELTRMHIARRPGDIPADRMPPFMAAFVTHALG